MPQTELVRVEDINLDLKNFRLLPQPDEQSALSSLIQSSPDYFWAVAASLLEDGYLPTENIILIRDGEDSKKLTVKEGNKRISILKLIHGHLRRDSVIIPTVIEEAMSRLTPEWLAANCRVPCLIFDASDHSVVDKLITRAHGKGEKSGREAWNTVARARHNRQINGKQELALDLLEKYLSYGLNWNTSQRDRWSASYPLPLLDEVAKKLAPRVGVQNAPDLVKNYPGIKFRSEFESIMRDIGLERLTFPIVRSNTDFAAAYGIPHATPKVEQSKSAPSNKGTPLSTSEGSGSDSDSSADDINSRSSRAGGSTPELATGARGRTGKAERAYATNDPRNVTKLLKTFTPQGSNRAKVVTLKNEALRLNIAHTPLAFCFVLRSLFEVSAKAYAEEHPTVSDIQYDFLDKKGKQQQRKLVDVLSAIVRHLTGDNMSTPFAKTLQGAHSEIARRDGLLSVTTLNQLVHSSTLSIIPGDICTLFVKIFPLLEAMNCSGNSVVANNDLSRSSEA